MYTVVVADDEEELRRALIRRVNWEAAGFRVIGEAENGVEALELVDRLEPDLLLTDIQMPFVSGIELARQVREIRPTMQIVFLSGYDDFIYAQQAIQYNIVSYLLKPISSGELLLELNKIKEKIDEKFKEFTAPVYDELDLSSFLMPLIFDEFQGHSEGEKEEELIETAIQCGLFKSDFKEQRYVVMVSSIYDEAGRNRTVRGNVNAIDIILRKYLRHVSFFAKGKVVSLLIATQSGFEKYLHIAVEDIVQSVKRMMDCECVIGVSRQIGVFSGIHEAYIEAMSAFGYSVRVDKDVHFISDVERNSTLDQESIQNRINELENYIRGGSRAELGAYLQQMIKEMDCIRISTMSLNVILIQFISAVFRVVYSVADPEVLQDLQQISPLQNLSFGESTQGMADKFIEFCLRARDYIAEQRKKSSSIICDKALDLIERRYMDQNLSLASISREISVSPNYLSTLIKKSTGSTFVELLGKKRIEKAKELLFFSSMKIRTIAEECGYSDQHYFSYCYKKYTGISPNDARRQSEKVDAHEQ